MFTSIVDACGVCYGDGTSCKSDHSECTVYSNPSTSFHGLKQNFVTFDCLVHKFQGYCEYILARDCSESTFDVHIKNDTPLQNAIGSAVAGGVAVRADGLGVIKAIFSGQKINVYMNDKRLIWPSTIDAVAGSRLLLSNDAAENRVEILLAATGVKVILKCPTKLVVSVPPSFKNKTCGL